MEEKIPQADQTEWTEPSQIETGREPALELSDEAMEMPPSEPLTAEVLKKPQGGKKKWIPALALSAVLLLAAAAAFLLYANRFTLTIVLEGEPEVLVEYGESYQEPGARAVISGKWLLKQGISLEEDRIHAESDLQEDTVGKYTVTYTAEFWGWQASAQRSVRVVDTQCPVITLVDSCETILPGQPYEEEGFTAMDNYDGDITDRVRRTEEMGVITYVVMDSSGNPACVEREIPYFDPIPPEIRLEGGEQLTIASGTIYSEPGFTALDNADGDITELVEVEGEVVWYQPGTYEVVYRVSDVYGNMTEVIRTVEVAAQPRPETVYPNGSVIYLTFDDGPGPYTGALLDVLKKYGVKATFFVTNSGHDSTMRRIANEGHSIGIHTMSHDYEAIYASPEAFFEDLYGMRDIIYRNTGVQTTLMRFPGGGSNLVSSFNEGIMTILTEAVQDAGFQYFDWNVDSNDAGGALRAETVANNVIAGVQNHRVSIVLQHDIHDFSVEAVEDIIIWGLNNGYTFLPLTENSPTMHHTVLN